MKTVIGLSACVKLTKRNLAAAVLLYELARELSTPPASDASFGKLTPSVTRSISDWSASTGLSPDQVSRALALLRDSGLIVCSHSRGLVIVLTPLFHTALNGV